MATSRRRGATSSSPGVTRAATLLEVAELAGVSIATASKALNGRADVAAATRETVRLAAARLSYSPNELARGLAAGRTGVVGLLTSDLEGRFSIPILTGAEDAFGTGETSVLLCDARGDADREIRHLRTLLSRRVDGLIVVGARPDPRPSLGRDLPVPVVYAYAPSVDGRDVSLVCDNRAGGWMAAQHLLGLGRRRIAHVTGDPRYGAARDRADGVVAALGEHGLSLAGGEVLFGSWSERWGREAIRTVLARAPDLDAVCAGSDQIARGVLDELHTAGIAVPSEVAVIGFDNWQALAEHAHPPLSSIDMDLAALGRRAAHRLSAAVAGTVGSGVEQLACRLVVRGSTVAD